MYTRIYFDSNPYFVIESKYYDATDLEPGYSAEHNLQPADLTAREIALLLDNDAESGNYHSLSTAHETIWRALDAIALERISDKVEAHSVVNGFMQWLLDKGGLHNF